MNGRIIRTCSKGLSGVGFIKNGKKPTEAEWQGKFLTLAPGDVSGGENPRIDGAVRMGPRRLAARQRFPRHGSPITGWIF
jgi:hypothetical protein